MLPKVCTFCVLDNDGVEISDTVISANEKLLKDYIRSIQGVKKLTLEELFSSHGYTLGS